jgi:hypothetical protein
VDLIKVLEADSERVDMGKVALEKAAGSIKEVSKVVAVAEKAEHLEGISFGSPQSTDHSYWL